MAVSSRGGDKLLEIANMLLSGADCRAASLARAGLTTRQIAQFTGFSADALAASFAWLERPEHYLLTADSPRYPEQLRAIDGFPVALFVAGNIELLASSQLAVVGSRNLSLYGERWGRLFCEQLAAAGLTITSGMALGIDAVAHRAALAVEGHTVAVLGNGLEETYPKRHRQLAGTILAMGGALISEFPLATAPWPGNFPRRNRIISGLSRGVLVVEATERSGSLVTARHALEQGREVFALPGPLGNPGSEGPHWLIKQGAALVSHPSDILEYLASELHWIPPPHKSLIYSRDEGAHTLPFPELLANVGDEVTPVDVVAERAGQPVPETVAQLLELELAGWIAAVPGGYVRLRRASHVRRTNVLI